MSNLKRRLEKVEDKVNSMEKETSERRARLLELERRGEGDSLTALMLRLEEQYGRRLTFSDLGVIALGRLPARDARRA
ncbi:MAG TPA: hypothetical protein VMW16_08055 [Sedimentisphaerales bacterium]|nr:hypothetical protein [Sedimentisphaerales bacterium]